MKLDKKEICRYSFIKIGNFYKANKSIEAKFDGKQLDNYNLAVKLIDEEFLNAEQSTYLIYRENELVYAGYYSNTLYDRWFRKQNKILYVWHGIEDKKILKDDLRNHPEKFSMWLTENPYSNDVNISKAIEDIIIMKEQPIGNKVGKDLEEQKNGAIKVSEILKNMNRNQKVIGVLWIFDNKIFFETQKIKDIKSINGFKDSNLSHYQVWDKVKNQHPKFYLYKYEDIPRGRVVYNIENKQFIIYCNENTLQEEISKKLILEKFQLLNEDSIFKEDEHYRIM